MCPTMIHLKWIKFGVNSDVNSGVNTGLNDGVNT